MDYVPTAILVPDLSFCKGLLNFLHLTSFT
jgi:hypothetical protein